MTEPVVHIVTELAPALGQAQTHAIAVQTMLPEVRSESGYLACFEHESWGALGLISRVEV